MEGAKSMLSLLLLAGVCLVLVSALGCASESSATATAVLAVKDQTPLAQAFEKGLLADNVQLDDAGASVILYDMNLVEDDGPGACAMREYAPAAPTTIRGPAQVKKVLHLDRPEALGAHLVLCVTPLAGEKGPLKIQVNGRSFSCRPVQAAGDDWPAIRLPLNLLKQGDNEVILSSEGKAGWCITTATRQNILLNAPERKDAPNRSFRSTDGGATWLPGLGDDGAGDGEFMVRLNLGQSVPRGELIGPVIDLAALTCGGEVPAGDCRVNAVRLRVGKRIREGTGIELSVRSGATPVYDPKAWGAWAPISIYGNASGDLKRFIQWRAVLTTDKPKTTPILDSVEVLADVRPVAADWAIAVTAGHCHNEEILYTSMPFEYERFDEPQLVELRAKYKLDEVVAGAKTEMERVIKLRNWLHAQWQYQAPIPYYPAWDAREIIEKKIGMCVQFAIAYQQVCLAMGYQSRYVFGKFPDVKLKDRVVSGHEVTEYWSNDLGKWVMMDPQRDEAFVSRATGQVTGMMELHTDQLDTYFPKGVDPNGGAFADGIPSEGLLWWKGDEPAPRQEKPVLDIKWGYLHWMPRNNFYAHRYPEPLMQGFGWSSPSYWLWQDERTPRQWRFGRYTRRHSDVEWTLNQVRWAVAPAKTAGTLAVTLGTVTPDFDTYLVSIDGGEAKPSAASFDWALHAGRNRVEMRIRTRAGIVGRPSWIELDYAPAE
jgi:hypothetical protein